MNGVVDLDQSQGSSWIILPVKEVKEAKQRLAAMLTTDQRRALCHAMLEDVLTEVTQVKAVDGILVVSSDPVAEDIKARYGVEIRPDPVAGLNGAVTDAARYLSARGVSTVLVIHGDLPLISHVEIEKLLAQHQPSMRRHLTLVADDKQDGSNVLIASPPQVIPFSYGDNSFTRHCQLAEAAGVPVNAVVSMPLALDIDRQQDLERLLQHYNDHPELSERQTYQLLKAFHLPFAERETTDSPLNSQTMLAG